MKSIRRKQLRVMVWTLALWSFAFNTIATPAAHAVALLSPSETTSTKYFSVDQLLDQAAQQEIAESTEPLQTATEPAQGRVLYVSKTGADTNAGTQTSPFASLAHAVNQLKAGDTLYIGEGTYSAATDFKASGTADAWINVIGVGNVVIDGSSQNAYDPAFDTMGFDYIKFSNLTVNNSRAGVKVSAGSHHIIVDGLKTDGNDFAVVMTDASFVTIQNSVAANSRNAFRGEGSTHDVLIQNVEAYGSKDIYDGYNVNYLNGDGFIFEIDTYNLTIRNVISHDHWDAGYDIKASNALLENVVSYNNKNNFKTWGQNVRIVNALSFNAKIERQPDGGANEGFGINVRQGSTTIVNSTFVNNENTDIKNGTSSANLTLINSIIARNVSSGRLLEQYGTFNHSNTLWYSANGSGIPSGAISSSNPGFVDWANRNFRLMSSSAAVNKGASNPNVPGYDMDGNVRVIGSAVDLGAYEYGTVQQPVDPKTYLTGITEGQTVSDTVVVQVPTALRSTVTNVSYKLNGAQSTNTSTSPFTWGGSSGFDTKTLANGTYTLQAAIQTTDKGLLNAQWTFTVENALPPVDPQTYLTGITSGQEVSGTVVVQVPQDLRATVTNIQYRLSGVLSTNTSTSPFTWGGSSGFDTKTLANGQYTLSAAIQTTDRGLLNASWTFTVANQVVTPGAGAFNETDGQVVMEGESFAGSTTFNGQTWTQVAQSGTSNGTGLKAGPEQGTILTPIGGPRADFNIRVNTPGTYYVWIRGYAADGGSDSLHVGLNGQALATGTNVNGFTFDGSGPSWTNRNASGARLSFTVNTAGDYTLNLWMREDGMVVDKIIATRDANFTPTGTGPAESARVGTLPPVDPKTYLTGIADGQELSGTVYVQVPAAQLPTVTNVSYKLNGVQSTQTTTAPYIWGGASGFDTKTLANGTYTLDAAIQTSDRGLLNAQWTFTVKNAIVTNPPSTGAFLEANGQIVMEGESFAGSTTVNGQAWQSADQTGTSGSKGLMAGPDLGRLLTSNTGPRADYKISVSAPGTYYVWIRGYADDGNSDSLHVGLNGQLLSSGTNVNRFSYDGSGPSWSNVNANGARVSFTVATAGEHTLNLWMREDGMVVDKILVTRDAGFAASGTGPVESTRVGTNPEPEPEPQPNPSPTRTGDNRFLGFTENTTVAGTVKIQPNTSAFNGVRAAFYYLNGTQSGKQYSSPFMWGGTSGFNTRTLANGTYTLSGIVKTNSGDVGFSYTFRVNNSLATGVVIDCANPANATHIACQ